MSNREFIETEVDKVINDKKFNSPLNFSMAAAWILGNFKGINLKVLDVHKTSSLCDFYVIASATNIIQAKSMADEVVTQLKRVGLDLVSMEGKNDSEWILIDLGIILVHVFQESSRSVYDLESLLADGKSIEIPQEYYFSNDDSEDTVVEPKSYF